MTKLTERFWPQWCNKNRPFLSEEQIVVDLVTKIRGSRSSLLWWTLIEQEDLDQYNLHHKYIVTRYYNIASPLNKHFSNLKESLDVIQLRILTKVWQYFNREIYDDGIETIKSAENRSD